MSTNLRLLILIVAYKAEGTIRDVIKRIPVGLSNSFDTQILIIDDSSNDSTYALAKEASIEYAENLSIEVLRNPQNLGYGGNQQVGFQYAIQKHFDLIALVHGDGQYAPEILPELLNELLRGDVAGVIGSRMLVRRSALQGGMPLYKYVGNRILTLIQNKILKKNLSEFHSGYRLYRVAALKRIPFDRNTRGFNFDTQVCYQLFAAGEEVTEFPIPTYYGDEICYVDGIRYAWEVLIETGRWWAHQVGFYYDLRYACSSPRHSGVHYEQKLGFDSTHEYIQKIIGRSKSVLDLGCGSGQFGEALRANKCRVIGVDKNNLPHQEKLDGFYKIDLDEEVPPMCMREFDYVLLMDVVEHLTSPEGFLLDLFARLHPWTDQKIVISTGNVNFLLSRILILFGMFNYGSRGILDITHKRLFNLHSFKRLCTQTGYEIDNIIGVPAPFQQVLGKNWLSATLSKGNRVLIKLWQAGFSWQLIIVARRRPSPENLLLAALGNSQGQDGLVE